MSSRDRATRRDAMWGMSSGDSRSSCTMATEGLSLRMSLRCACDPVPVGSALVQGGGRWVLTMTYSEAAPTELVADGAEPWPESD